MINRAAVAASVGHLPEFIGGSRNEVIYNAYEPDRWREERDSPLDIAQAPDHFFDSELFGSVLDIDSDRFRFMEKISARKVELVRIGYLPYSIIENYTRLRNAFRQFRNSTTPEDRAAARANAVFYAGVLGHYVGDGAQPLHMTIHYNGWVDNAPNPKGYTRDRKLHSRYEHAFVESAAEYSELRDRVKPPRRLSDVFGEVRQYLNQSLQEMIPLYEMEKTGEFNPDSPRPRGREFVLSQLGRAATMLRDLWYTAWIESGEPLPDRRPR